MLTTDLDLIDTRIINQATTLTEAGYTVRLLMPSKTAGSYSERVNGFEVCRVAPATHTRRALLRVMAARSWRGAFRVVEEMYGEQLRRAAPAGGAGGADAPSPPVPSGRDGETAPPDGEATLADVSRLRRAVYEVGKKRRLTYSYLLMEAPFARAAREFRPDVVHVHDLPLLRLGRMLAEESGAKLVYDAHEFYPYQYQDDFLVRFWTERERADIHSPDLTMTVNSFIADILEKFYRTGRVQVVHNAAPYERHLERREESRAWLTRGARPPAGGRLCVLLYLGGLAEERGAFELVEMLSLLPDHYLLAIMGGGEVRGEIEERAARRGVAARMIFHGMLPREQVPGLVVGADVGLVTQKPVALCQINCSPNRLSDYVMAGLALALSDLPFLRRFVETYDCGALFDPTDPRSMAETVRDLFEDPARFDRLRRNSLEAAKEFNWDVEGGKFLRLYEGLGLGQVD
jgi:glycosyltransferase involved in cell wall biosynthesis